MLHLVSGLYTEWTRKVPFNILVLGPEGVGKSCLIEGVKATYDKKPGLPMDKVRPTVGQNVYEMPVKADLLRFWDLGGSEDMRRIWSRYYKDCNALLWVIDAKWLDDESEEMSLTQVQDGEDKEAREPVTGPLERTSSSLAQKRQMANIAWDLLRSVMEDPAMRSIPILIALNQVDTLSSPFAPPTAGLAASTPKSPAASTVHDSQLEVGVDLDELEERARLWWGSRIAGLEAGESITLAEAGDLDSTGERQPATDSDSPAREGTEPPATPTSPQADQRERIWDVVCTSVLDRTGISEMVQWLCDAAEDRRTRLREQRQQEQTHAHAQDAKQTSAEPATS